MRRFPCSGKSAEHPKTLSNATYYLVETQWTIKSELEDIAQREIELKQQAEKETQETQEVERAISEMKHKKKTKEEYKASLLAEISDLPEVIEKKKLGMPFAPTSSAYPLICVSSVVK